jgi:hypothetical protein
MRPIPEAVKKKAVFFWMTRGGGADACSIFNINNFWFATIDQNELFGGFLNEGLLDLKISSK